MYRTRWLLLLAVALVALVVDCKRLSHGTAPTPHTQPSSVGTVHYGAASPRSQWTDYEDLGADASGVAKATPGNLYGTYAINNNAAIRYLQFFDSATGPAGAAVPRLQFGIPAGGGEIIIGSDFWQTDGIGFNSGIAWGISTTKGTFTAATPGDHDVMVIYR